MRRCSCSGCQGLRTRYAGDDRLLNFYAQRLLQRGWAGVTDDVEKAYMTAHAEWYKAAQEKGRQSPIGMGHFKRVVQTSGASAPPAEVNTTLRLFR